MAEAIGRHLQIFAAHARQLAVELSEDEFWTRPYPYGNTFGHLVLHLTGATLVVSRRSTAYPAGTVVHFVL